MLLGRRFKGNEPSSGEKTGAKKVIVMSGPKGPDFLVRPAWAHSWRCKSSRELATANEVKRNCGRVTDRGEEAWSVNREPMNKNRI